MQELCLLICFYETSLAIILYSATLEYIRSFLLKPMYFSQDSMMPKLLFNNYIHPCTTERYT